MDAKTASRTGPMKYGSGFKYQLTENFTIQTAIYPEATVEWLFVTLHDTGLLEIRKGWAWDGPSGCTLDTRDSMIAALVHDALYALMQRQLLSWRWRIDADQLFHALLIENGMWSWRARYWYRAVRELGYAFAHKPKKIRTAP
jgi:hypothetical protein